jgi:hypothetical protein
MASLDLTLEHVLGWDNGERPEGLPGHNDEPDDFIPCCMGSVHNGPRGCTCWTPIFDVEQCEDLQEGPMPRARKCCHDCAYRQGSPERERGETDHLEDIAVSDKHIFICHQGMRGIVGWKHPDYGEVPYTGAGDYRPPKVQGRAYMADGRPGVLCAGAEALSERWRT